jgi:hypothetical protein
MIAWPVMAITSVSTSVSWMFICTSAFCMRSTQLAWSATRGHSYSLQALADIERGFKVLKSEIQIGPVYHRLPERI